MTTYLVVLHDESKHKVRANFAPSGPDYARVVEIPQELSGEPPEAIEIVDLFNELGVKTGESLQLNVTEKNAILAQEQADNQARAAAEAPRLALRRAIDEGRAIEEDFSVDNIMMGITQDGMTGQVLDAMMPTILALRSGSLYEAMDRMRAIPESDKDPKYVNDARLLAALNRIERHLGLPESPSL